MVVIAEQINTGFMAFRDFSTQFIEDTFQLVRVETDDISIMRTWLEMPFEITNDTKEQLEILRHRLDKEGIGYNEDELKWKFINPLVNLVDYYGQSFNVFLERLIRAEVNGKNIGGRLDFMLASGKYEPSAPFFFIHEYKKETGTNDDPLGQLLGGMLVAQELNNNQHPIYGCYLIGRLWMFVVLQGQEYAVTSGHVATNKDIFEIYGMLVKMKTIIEEQLLK